MCHTIDGSIQRVIGACMVPGLDTKRVRIASGLLLETVRDRWLDLVPWEFSEGVARANLIARGRARFSQLSCFLSADLIVASGVKAGEFDREFLYDWTLEERGYRELDAAHFVKLYNGSNHRQRISS